ncbi:MAG TPA: hypothetical protein VF510_24625 [Ktedonobacterales bacterium]
MALPLRVVTEEEHTKKSMSMANELLRGERSGVAFLSPDRYTPAQWWARLGHMSRGATRCTRQASTATTPSRFLGRARSVARRLRQEDVLAGNRTPQ